MKNSDKSLSDVLKLMHEAMALLHSAETAWPDAVASASFPVNAPEADAIENLLHAATHEVGSGLGFAIQDIERLLERVEIRRKYPMFEGDELDKIVSHGWSTAFVAETHKKHLSMSLAELSAQIKSLCVEWNSLKKLSLSPREP